VLPTITSSWPQVRMRPTCWVSSRLRWGGSRSRNPLWEPSRVQMGGVYPGGITRVISPNHLTPRALTRFAAFGPVETVEPKSKFNLVQRWRALTKESPCERMDHRARVGSYEDAQRTSERARVSEYAHVEIKTEAANELLSAEGPSRFTETHYPVPSGNAGVEKGY
jgi:hypothetical protein